MSPCQECGELLQMMSVEALNPGWGGLALAVGSTVISVVAMLVTMQTKVTYMGKEGQELKAELKTAVNELKTVSTAVTVAGREQLLINQFTTTSLAQILKRLDLLEMNTQELREELAALKSASEA